MLDVLVGIAKNVAPGLATALTGPLGGLAVKALADKLGTDSDPKAIVEHIQANPTSLKSVEELEHEQFKAVLADKQDARDMQEQAMKSDDPLVRRFVYYFIAFWSVLSASYIGFITFYDIPENNIRFADTILGFVLGTMVASMFQFLLGSSLGSRNKDKK